MTMKKQIVAIVLLPVLLLTFFSGCASQESDTLKSKLIGTWTAKYAILGEEKEYPTESITLSFYENGTLQGNDSESFSDETRWSLDEEENTLIISDGVQLVHYKILKLTASELLLGISSEYMDESGSYQVLFGR